MAIRKKLIQNNPILEEFTKTPQYHLSRLIMKVRYKHSLTEKEVAKTLNIPFNNYISLECGDTNISKETYQNVIKQMQKQFKRS